MGAPRPPLQEHSPGRRPHLRDFDTDADEGGAVPRLLSLLTGLGALNAAAAGLVWPSLYRGAVPAALRPGLLGQDLVSVVAASVLVGLMLLGRTGPRGDAVAAGLVAYLAYAYGLLTLEHVLNGIFLLYLAVFALGVWALALTARAHRTRVLPPPDRLRLAAAAGAALPVVVLVPLRIGALLPLSASHRPSAHALSVAVLDLGFVMPAFLAAAVLLLLVPERGLRFSAVLFVLGGTLMASVAAAAAAARPLLGIDVGPGRWFPALALGALLLALAVMTLRALRVESDTDAADRVDLVA